MRRRLVGKDSRAYLFGAENLVKAIREPLRESAIEQRASGVKARATVAAAGRGGPPGMGALRSPGLAGSPGAWTQDKHVVTSCTDVG